MSSILDHIKLYLDALVIITLSYLLKGPENTYGAVCSRSSEGSSIVLRVCGDAKPALLCGVSVCK